MSCSTECVRDLPNVVLVAFVVLGSFQLLKFLLGLLQGLRFLIFSGVNVKKYGQWAVVTGATDGIGLAYAKQLARKGLEVDLISRSAEKLKSAEAEVKAANKTPVNVKTIEADFSVPSEALFKKIADELAQLDIAILVNNVGVSYDHAQYFDKLDDSTIDKLINVNVITLTKLTKIVLPRMAEKKKGIIINVGSAAGLIPIGDPLYSVYSGTKAYVDFFSKSLNLEYKSKGVIIENHVPYFVVSKLSKIRKASLGTPTPGAYAASALAKIGYAASVVPFWAHAAQHWVLTSLPTFIVSKIVLSHHLGIYKRAIKKNEEKKTQ